ncbi:unnamed protein product [Protopolystoma xenopodis]|uniref:Uncharacterized protein n=1 Tax=Protopolystoma xenopodis TaxID=117903 RepID=A0A448X0Q6_9PLAT|nr:unnamed protein product [Protopolystoma xenopodis]
MRACPRGFLRIEDIHAPTHSILQALDPFLSQLDLLIFVCQRTPVSKGSVRALKGVGANISIAVECFAKAAESVVAGHNDLELKMAAACVEVSLIDNFLL